MGRRRGASPPKKGAQQESRSPSRGKTPEPEARPARACLVPSSEACFPFALPAAGGIAVGEARPPIFLPSTSDSDGIV